MLCVTLNVRRRERESESESESESEKEREYVKGEIWTQEGSVCEPVLICVECVVAYLDLNEFKNCKVNTKMSFLFRHSRPPSHQPAG